MVQSLIELFVERAFESNDPLTIGLVGLFVLISSVLLLWINKQLMGAILKDLNLILKVIALATIFLSALYSSAELIEELSGFIVAAAFGLFALGITNHSIREQSKDAKRSQ